MFNRKKKRMADCWNAGEIPKAEISGLRLYFYKGTPHSPFKRIIEETGWGVLHPMVDRLFSQEH